MAIETALKEQDPVKRERIEAVVKEAQAEWWRKSSRMVSIHSFVHQKLLQEGLIENEGA